MTTITLEPVDGDDRDALDTLVSWIRSEKMLRQWTDSVFSHPLDTGQLADHLTDSDVRRQAFAAVDDDGSMVGYLELNRIDETRRSASIARVVVAPDHRGEGVATEMLRAVLRIGFEDYDCHRIDLRVFDFNEAAIRCYERVGFTREGTLRDARRYGDEYWSLVVMSLLEDEWTAK
ncbi:GNAT family N-acetyltransferase [Halogranum rubrum]|uniref:N-acetyltransferase domain-containing protein n=1 Tax=Halogranum salarium B-1 TaxID=1210908 RepID=J3A179_9EURY|nr:GNAT family protein [Halogranum salarium]EJN59078.1 hypothetical protein HSB1_24990 [Halogranum salarium B-1]